MKITHEQIQTVRAMPAGHEKNLAMIALLRAAAGTMTEAVAIGYGRLAQELVS